MNILALKTDQPTAELYLFDGATMVQNLQWQAHRQLAETIHFKIQDLLDENSLKLSDLQAVIVYQGPGSFTGLRIGVSVANALAYGIGIPAYGANGDNWLQMGLEKAANNQPSEPIVPDYGADAHITQPKK